MVTLHVRLAIIILVCRSAAEGFAVPRGATRGVPWAWGATTGLGGRDGGRAPPHSLAVNSPASCALTRTRHLFARGFLRKRLSVELTGFLCAHAVTRADFGVKVAPVLSAAFHGGRQILGERERRRMGAEYLFAESFLFSAYKAAAEMLRFRFPCVGV